METPSPRPPRLEVGFQSLQMLHTNGLAAFPFNLPHLILSNLFNSNFMVFIPYQSLNLDSLGVAHPLLTLLSGSTAGLNPSSFQIPISLSLPNVITLPFPFLSFFPRPVALPTFFPQLISTPTQPLGGASELTDVITLWPGKYLGASPFVILASSAISSSERPRPWPGHWRWAR